MENKIYELIEKLHTEMQEMKSNMATKDDIKNMATKDDIKNMATKDDIKNMATKDDIKNMATKDDIKNMATKDDIKNMATKDDIKELKSDIKNLENKIENIVAEQQKDIMAVLKITHNQLDDKLDKIYSELEFFNHKEKQNEKELFILKRNNQLTKRLEG